MDNLQGKHAFITGGAGGVGLGIGKACAEAGMIVTLADMRQSALDEALNWFAENGYQAQGILLDVTDRPGYAVAVDKAEAGFGPVQLLVNNAGVTVGKAPIWQFTDDDIDFVVDVNIKGIVNGVKTLVPRMLERGEPAHVLSTASHAGLCVIEGMTPYNFTKAAIAAMMETMASDLQGTNVGVSLFFPGWVVSDLVGTSKEVRPANLPDRTMTTAPQKFGTPEPCPDEGIQTAPDISKGALSAEASGAFAVRGVQRGDLYIFTHPEFKDGLCAKHNAMMRAFPTDQEPDPERIYLYKTALKTVAYNSIYDTQEQR
jgi:NAD(P)-dependent dehydrogenase (short-subunit alcohol dehydrogenase family)